MSAAEDAAKRHGALDVTLQLAGQQMYLNERGVWVSSAAHSVPDTDMTSYKERVERVESEATTLLAKVHKLEEQRQLLEFKNRVLTEMLAVSQLDTQKSMAELKREKLKVEALKWELAHVSLHRAEQE